MMVVLTLFWVNSAPQFVYITNFVFVNCSHFPLSPPLFLGAYLSNKHKFNAESDHF